MQQKSLEEKKKTVLSKVPYEPEHVIVCNRNGIKIYYEGINNIVGRIVIDDNGKLRIGEYKYKNQGQKFTKTDKLWWKVVEQLYTQEYLKLPLHLRGKTKAEVEFEILIFKEKMNEKQKG